MVIDGLRHWRHARPSTCGPFLSEADSRANRRKSLGARMHGDRATIYQVLVRGIRMGVTTEEPLALCTQQEASGFTLTSLNYTCDDFYCLLRAWNASGGFICLMEGWSMVLVVALRKSLYGLIKT